MRIGWKHLGATIAATATLGMLIVWLGVIDIRASTGHWRATDWFLHWVMRSSVRTAAIGTEVPDLRNPDYLPMAASHYEAACADCHGSPERARSPVTMGMLPPPPALEGVVGLWSDAQLFEIVKHGVRYTGMPTWPASNRDDEVWAMVAFLRQYPQLDAGTYRQLAGRREQQASTAPVPIVAGCDACHDPGRLGRNALIPRLDGQSETYLRESLHAFRTGARPSGIMQAAISGLDEQALASLARFYAQRGDAELASQTVPDLVAMGDAMRGIPACSTCHDGPGLNPAYPTLSGLGRGYIVNQLRLFKSNLRGGGPYQHLMARSAKNLTEEDIAILAEYYSAR